MQRVALACLSITIALCTVAEASDGPCSRLDVARAKELDEVRIHLGREIQALQRQIEEMRSNCVCDDVGTRSSGGDEAPSLFRSSEPHQSNQNTGLDRRPLMAQVAASSATSQAVRELLQTPVESVPFGDHAVWNIVTPAPCTAEQIRDVASAANASAARRLELSLTAPMCAACLSQCANKRTNLPPVVATSDCSITCGPLGSRSQEPVRSSPGADVPLASSGADVNRLRAASSGTAGLHCSKAELLDLLSAPGTRASGTHVGVGWCRLGSSGSSGVGWVAHG